MFNWWMHTTFDNNGINFNGVDSRIIIPEECGNIFSELFNYTIELVFEDGCNNVFFPKVYFPKVLFKEKDLLLTNVNLPIKDELENFNDLRFTIKTYRHIFAPFLSLGIIPEPKTIDDNIKLELFREDIDNRGRALEYYLLNNPLAIINNNIYYDGRLELNYYHLIQKMFNLGLEGDYHCQWLLAFGTPLRIWYICNVQIIYCMWRNTPQINSNRDYLNNILKWEKNLYEYLNCYLTLYKNISEFCLIEGVQYTVAQLYGKGTSISGSYRRYIEGIVKQARLLRRGIIRSI